MIVTIKCFYTIFGLIYQCNKNGKRTKWIHTSLIHQLIFIKINTDAKENKSYKVKIPIPSMLVLWLRILHDSSSSSSECLASHEPLSPV